MHHWIETWVRDKFRSKFPSEWLNTLIACLLMIKLRLKGRRYDRIGRRWTSVDKEGGKKKKKKNLCKRSLRNFPRGDRKITIFALVIVVISVEESFRREEENGAV